MNQTMKELIMAYSWEEVSAKNMVSFKKDDYRLNYYPNGTVTIQQAQIGSRGKMVVNEKAVYELIQLETILMNL